MGGREAREVGRRGEGEGREGKWMEWGGKGKGEWRRKREGKEKEGKEREIGGKEEGEGQPVDYIYSYRNLKLPCIDKK